MSDRVQPATFTCYTCGHVGEVRKISPHEFEGFCAQCARVTMSWSWAHAGAPPIFEGEQTPRLPLRSEDA